MNKEYANYLIRFNLFYLLPSALLPVKIGQVHDEQLDTQQDG